MAVEKISIETLREELKDRKVRLTLESESLNNVMSPIKCKIEFENINVNIIHPASIHLYGEGRDVKLSQINCIHKENRYGVTVYILNCGKLAQTSKDFILECL